ncbi:hypothetical protein PABG_03740 [Paracoccidioides brasiliensis Pb03]|uniref:Glycosyl transferase CAP10 domain-containing protein n=1 Tax=Paracoccidioides brasiliensis (strain Pb18) TaxID=502780 RepID=C1FZP7_PARBD|nr:uncharacterized protein PADG_00087 [Paracoccidioides brasiliensis Pb18]EEH21524.1 hypothetical protein PABG_03740 [Paracoccidioides brasiliensis Pb03]EEH43798.1 hypothetical protein PADG_00087 [Paracoccidioides brasiliensis Pb18]ODH51894.1 hypothetical protein GX48_01903 [Paracoccidioides brasiliensis]
MLRLGLSGRYVTLAAFSVVIILGVLYAFVSRIYTCRLLYLPTSQSQIPRCRPAEPPVTNNSDSDSARVGDIPWQFVTQRDGDNYGLSRAQCQKAFPKLYVEIEKAVVARRGRNITLDELNSEPLKHSMVRAMIYQGELSIINFEDMAFTFTRAKASLHSLNRALNAIPNRQEIPNIEFIFTAEDFHDDPHPVWVYSKRESDSWAWLMPDFGYWSWPEIKAGQYRSVRKRIAAIDEGTTINGKTQQALKFQDKKKQLLWRGNLETAPELRQSLVDATKGKSWASVRALDWANEQSMREDYIPIEDHCRYMFLAHVEGRSYSGRGKYIQNCRSVFVAHQLTWREAHHPALIATGPNANYVKVKRDFSDLESKIHYLLDNPDVAEKIAENSVRTFRDLYLTPAAEACYWRELIHAYASVCDFEPVLYTESGRNTNSMRGVPFESFALDWKLPKS